MEPRTFSITQAVRCNRNFANAILDVMPDLQIAEMRCNNDVLTILRPLTDEQASAIAGSIAAIKQAIELQKTAERVNTFAWMQGRPAQEWKRMLKRN